MYLIMLPLSPPVPLRLLETKLDILSLGKSSLLQRALVWPESAVCPR